MSTTNGTAFHNAPCHNGIERVINQRRTAREVVDENGVILYHENLEPGLNGFWVEAKDLKVGDVFLGANGELSTLVNAVRVEQEGGIAVFNFTVDGNHNYFILAKEYEYGQTCVLVHNASCSSHSQKLGRNMVKAGTTRPTDTAAHHIVASGAQGAAKARSLLRKLLGKQKLEDAFNHHLNGVFLTSAQHKGLHTQKYYDEVTKRLVKATKDTINTVLKQIASQIKAGTFPH